MADLSECSIEHGLHQVDPDDELGQLCVAAATETRATLDHARAGRTKAHLGIDGCGIDSDRCCSRAHNLNDRGDVLLRATTGIAVRNANAHGRFGCELAQRHADRAEHAAQHERIDGVFETAQVLLNDQLAVARVGDGMLDGTRHLVARLDIADTALGSTVGWLDDHARAKSVVRSQRIANRACRSKASGRDTMVAVERALHDLVGGGECRRDGQAG